jgi:hypothetical protein
MLEASLGAGPGRGCNSSPSFPVIVIVHPQLGIGATVRHPPNNALTGMEHDGWGHDSFLNRSVRRREAEHLAM